VSRTECIDAADIASFAAHLGHIWSSPQFKGGAGIVTKLRLEPGSPPGSARVAVRLEGLRGRSAYGAVLRPGSPRVRFEGWVPSAGQETQTAAVDTLDGEGRRLVVLAFSVEPDASGVVELGTLLFTTICEGMAIDDLPIAYKDVALYGDGLASMPILQATRSSATRLHPNEPNPFNPRTTIRYTLGDPGRTSLEVFAVSGRRVRALVRGWQDPGEHAVVWDGRDEAGRDVGAGIYVVRLVAAGREESRKLVVLR
jgi:hypothetical protein